MVETLPPRLGIYSWLAYFKGIFSTYSDFVSKMFLKRYVCIKVAKSQKVKQLLKVTDLKEVWWSPNNVSHRNIEIRLGQT